MVRLTTTYNACPSCGAGVGARATACALCDAPLPRGGRRSASQRTPQAPDALPVAQQRLWRELALALSRSIRIVGFLDEGGMGSVFLGYDVALKREVAIKVLALELAEDETARERFKREAEAAGGVSHPNVVAIYQVGELLPSAVPYFVMQYVDGPTLQHAVEHHRVLAEAKVRRILCDVAGGLAAAHRRGVVHRDVKPNNIVLDAETARALVLDFGIAAALDVRRTSGSLRLTTEGMYIGTPMYMSPEQAGTGEVTDRSDIYSLAVVAFELLTGRLPFTGSNPMALMAAHLRDQPPRVDSLRPDVSAELASLLDRCLAKNPKHRPSSQALVDFFDPDAAAAAVAWPPPGLEWGRGVGARFVVILAALGATLLLFFSLLHAWPGPGSPAGQGGERSLLGLTAVLAFVLVGMSIGTGARVARLVGRARRAGYPWPVVADVLADRWRDTDALLNGRGRYALTDAPGRIRFMKLRRAQAALFATAAATALVGPVLWLLGALMLSAPGAELVTRAELLALLVPPLLLGAAGLLCAIPEVRWRRRNATTGHAGADASVVREELVQSWLQASRRGERSPSRIAHGPLIVGLVIVLSGSVMATVGLSLLAVLMSSALFVQHRPAAAALTARFGAPPATPATAPTGSGSGAAAGMASLFANPAAPLGQQFVTSRSLPEGLHAEVPLQVAAGLCMNAREMLFGADPRRVELVRSAVPTPHGMDGSLRAMNAQRAEAWLVDPASAGESTVFGQRQPRQPLLSRMVDRTLDLLGLGGVRDRMKGCAAFLRA